MITTKTLPYRLKNKPDQGSWEGSDIIFSNTLAPQVCDFLGLGTVFRGTGQCFVSFVFQLSGTWRRCFGLTRPEGMVAPSPALCHRGLAALVEDPPWVTDGGLSRTCRQQQKQQRLWHHAAAHPLESQQHFCRRERLEVHTHMIAKGKSSGRASWCRWPCKDVFGIASLINCFS